MRIFFIPGLGEEILIFDKIKPFINGEKVFIDNWTLLAELDGDNLSVLEYAQFLINRYQITSKDVVIGHSMGGWIALHIKHFIGCRIIQIASWTDMKKVGKPGNKHVIYWSARHGIGLNNFVLNILVFLQYRRAPSKEIFTRVFKKIISGDKKVFEKQLKIIFNTVRQNITVTPDLRIHSRSDNIVQQPDEPFIEVPSDHFTLYTFPDAVYPSIVDFLNNPA